MTDGPPKGRQRTGPPLHVLSPLAGATIFAGATIGLVIALLVVGLWKDRMDRLAQVRSEAETRAILLAQHADGVLRQVDIALAAAAFNLEEHAPEGTRAELRDPLQRFMARHLPTGGCLVIFGPDGGIRSSACPRTADLALDAATLRDHAGGRITGSMGHDHVLGLIALRRSILDRRGRFLGIAQASFQAVALLGYGHTAGVEHVEILALADGDIVVGPSDMFAGQRQDVADDAVALIGGGSRGAGAIQVAERDGLIAAAAQTRVLPLLAIAATRTGETLAAWWRTVTIAALIVGVLAAGALLLLARLFHIERSRSDAISELRLKDHALAQSSNGILICRAGTDTPIAWVNHAFERNTGYTSAEVVGRNPRFMHGAEIAQPALEEIRRALRDSMPVVATVRNFRKDGSPFYNQVSIAPVCDDDGRLTHFIGIQHDVTDRILAERALEDRARFEHTLLDTIPLPVFFKDMDGVYLGANRAFEQALGLERGGIRGLRVTDIADPEIAEIYAEVDRDLRMHGGSRTFETKVRYADGSLRAAVISKAVFLNAASQRAGIIGVFSDIDEIRRREAELANLVDQRDRERARAEEANRAKSNFLACMSHELRTPLNAILGFSEIIRERSFGDDLDRYAEYAGDIHASGEHLLSLINDILDLSKIEAGKLDLAPNSLAIGPVVNSVIKLVRQRAEDHGHSLHVDLGDAAEEQLYADERAVKQILFNLLSNAIKFTPDRGRIDLACRLQAGSRMELSVSDTGIGIPADRLLTVLQPFERIDSAYTRGQEGTGLGLSLVDALVKGHGGTLAIDSTVDVGTRVRVTLPTVKQASGMAA